MIFKKIMLLAYTALLISSPPTLARIGTESGGGGDATESRVNEIRSDILKWIENKGARALIFPKYISYYEYVLKMEDVLQNQKVIIGFTEEKVIYRNAEKTCKSFVAKDTDEMHMLCNISRFEKTKDSDQYRLIHHEYAGLAGIEKNEGAASDYNISNQITDFLSYETVLRLAVKKDLRKKCTIYAKDDLKELLDFYIMSKRFKEQGYKYSSEEEAQFTIEKFTIHAIIDNTSPDFNSEMPQDGPIHEIHANIAMKNNINDKKFEITSLITKNHKKKKKIRVNDALLELALSIPKCKGL